MSDICAACGRHRLVHPYDLCGIFIPEEIKEMSVKELKLTTNNTDLEVVKVRGMFEIEITSLDGHEGVDLDRNQAHLLYLYLKEHLNV